MSVEALSVRQQFEQGVGPYENAQFGRVITAMVTPFEDSPQQEFNPHHAQALAQFLVEHGSEGLVLAGTTGESTALSHDETFALFEAVREAVDVPILAGVGKSDTHGTTMLAVEVAERELADGLLVVTPPYVRPTQGGLRAHFREVAHATELPIVVYDIPGRTGQGLADETMLDIAQLDTVVALKDASGSIDRALQIGPELRAAGVDIYSGDDGLNLRFAREAGAVSAISVASHWAGLELQAMFDALESGDDERAEWINEMLRPSFRFETGDDRRNPIATKALLRAALMLPVGYGRSPMVTDDRDLDIALEQRGSEVYSSLKGERIV